VPPCTVAFVEVAVDCVFVTSFVAHPDTHATRAHVSTAKSARRARTVRGALSDMEIIRRPSVHAFPGAGASAIEVPDHGAQTEP